ncbi:MAG: cytidine deaminase [Tissierellaceae bacterium]|jgi:cytidine deaminase
MNKTQLIEMALKAQKNAYVPYSNFHVGATVLMKDGSIYTGCNIEVSSYSPTICAERTAIFKAVSEGSREIDTIVIVGDADPTYPCGVCRQVIREFGRDAKIIIASSVDRYREYTIDDLLPHSFGPEDLEENR